MSKKKIVLLIILTIPLLTACTTVKVKPLTVSRPDTPICIIKNDDVIVTDFLNVVQDGFSRHNLNTKIFRDRAPESCEIILTYTALQSWDITTYLSHAELWLRNTNGNQIAYAKYHLKGGGACLALNKWANVESKIDPVMDKLLKHYE